MKQPSTYLHELIKSLTPNEKGYVKKHLGASAKESNIIHLFDYIEQQEKYNEKELIAHFKKENFIKQLSRTKNYLYNKVLGNLRNYHSKVYARVRVKNMVSEIEILLSKALYKQCYDHLKLAKKKAFEHELFLSLIEILIWELELAKSIHPIDKLEAAVDKINEELKEAITSLFDLVEHYQIHSEFSVFFSNTPTGRLDPETLFNNTIGIKNIGKLFEQNPAKSIEAKFMRLRLKGTFYSKAGAYEKGIASYLDALNLIETNPSFLNEHPKFYLEIVNRLGVAYIHNEEFDKCYEIAKKYDKHSSALKEIIIKVNMHKMNLYTANMIESREYNIFLKKEKEFEAIWEEYNESFEPTYYKAIGFNLFYLNFLNNNLKKALRYWHHMDSTAPYVLREDLSDAAIFGYFALTADLNDWNLLESKARSVSRSTKITNESVKKIANMFLRLTRRSGDVNLVYQDMLELTSTANDLGPALYNFDLKGWISSKIQGVSFGSQSL